jgi:two-component system, LuxR family, sensor kinase FixL
MTAGGSHEPMRATLEALPDATVLVGASAAIGVANHRAEDLFGYASEDLPGRRFCDLVKGPDQERAAAALESRRGVLELRCVRKDGSEVDLQMSVGAVDPPAADAGSAVVVLRPGLALTQALVKLLSSAPDAIVIVRRDGVIVLTNDRVETLFGYRQEELLGRPVEMLVPTRIVERHPRLRDSYFRDPTVRLAHSRTGDLIGRRKDGSEFPVDIMLSPVNAEVGMLAIASIRDATDRKNLEEARLAVARAEEALRLRDEFLSLAAHELRTPLTPMRLMVDRIVRDAAREQAVVDSQLAGQLDDALERLEDRVAELLETASILSGGLTLTREEVDLGDLVREEVERARKQARAGTQINVVDASLVGIWDRGGIRQVVAELLSNAIKFGGGAPIDLTVEREAQMAVLTVRDRGIGVAPENREKLFERFARFESSTHYAGLGIGLWLAKQVVEGHGGHIGMRAEGEGAILRIDLPLR